MSDADGDDDRTSDPENEANWPVTLEGATETVVTTLGPNGRWNAAALGLFAGPVEDSREDGRPNEPGHPESRMGHPESQIDRQRASARTWGNTRTRRNFHRRGTGYVQFTRDPGDFVDAALSIYELEEPVLESADAWVRVSVERIDSGAENGTEWEDWQLRPLESAVETETVPTINRGFCAVIEATVAASRLEVEGYDESVLRDRLDHCASIVERAGSDREREALSRVREHTDW